MYLWVEVYFLSNKMRQTQLPTFQVYPVVSTVTVKVQNFPMVFRSFDIKLTPRFAIDCREPYSSLTKASN